jgi:hypothetical protein
MRENTPPTSPYHESDEEDLVYVGDDIDEVIEHLEGMPENDEEEIDGEGESKQK